MLPALVLPQKAEILMVRPEWSLPSGNPRHTGRAEHWNRAWHVALSTLWSEQKAAVTVVSPGLFRQKMWYFPSLLVLLSLCPNRAGMPQSQHKVLILQFSPWVLILRPQPRGQAGASLLYCAFVSTGRARARWLYWSAKHIPTSWP